MRARSLVLLALAAAALLLPGARPARAGEPGQAELLARMKLRYKELYKLRRKGKVGETFDGLVEAVKPEYLEEKVQIPDYRDPDKKQTVTVEKLLTDENADRKAYYKLVAEEERTTEKEVALTAGKRNYRRLKPGEYFKLPSGKWTKKE